MRLHFAFVCVDSCPRFVCSNLIKGIDVLTMCVVLFITLVTQQGLYDL